MYGGITYTAKITDLKAGESRKITPFPLCKRIQPCDDGADLRYGRVRTRAENCQGTEYFSCASFLDVVK